MAESRDKWVVDVSIDTKSIDEAYKKMAKLKEQMTSLYAGSGNKGSAKVGGGYSTTGGSHSSSNWKSGEFYQMSRNSEKLHRQKMRQLREEQREIKRTMDMEIDRDYKLQRAAMIGGRLNKYGLNQKYGARLEGIKESLARSTTPTGIRLATKQMSLYNMEVNEAIRAQKQLQREQEKMGLVGSKFTNSFKNMIGAYASVFAVSQGVLSMYDRAKQMQSMNAASLMASGSASQAAKDRAMIYAKAQETGLGIAPLTDMFNKVVISAKDAKLNEKEQQAIFEGITTLQVGYGFNTEQQKLVSKAFAQMLGKQQVMAEEFKNQLGDQAPGIMGMMVEAGGYKDVKDLAKAMKDGEVGLKQLTAFIEIAKKRAIETGAYTAGTQSMGAYEMRVSNAFTNFSSSFMSFFEDTIKTSFANTTSSLESLAKYFKDMKAEEDRTGNISGFTTAIDFFVEAVDLFGEVIQQSLEGYAYLLSKLGINTNMKAGVKDYLASRQMEELYFSARGDNTMMARAKTRQLGMPGYSEFAKSKYISLGATEEVATKLAGGLTVANDTASKINPLAGTLLKMSNPAGMAFSSLLNGGVSGSDITKTLASIGQMFTPTYGAPTTTTFSPVINITGVKSADDVVPTLIPALQKEAENIFAMRLRELSDISSQK